MPNRGVRVDPAEVEVWRVAAGVAGLSLNAWIRRSCNEAAAFERVLREQELREPRSEVEATMGGA